MGILVIDDSKESRNMIKSTLVKSGHSEVILTESVEKAFNVLVINGSSKEPVIDLIIININMPIIHIIEICHTIREKPFLKDAPIIIVIPEYEKENLNLEFSDGTIDYITRPIQKVELITRARLALKLSREIRARKTVEMDLRVLIGRLGEANRVLYRLSYLDEITGIANRNFFLDALNKEWARRLRDGNPLSLIMCGIDSYERLVDTYGSMAGVNIYKKVVRVIASELKRPGDVIARYAKDKIVVLLPNTDSLGAVVMAEILCAAVASSRISYKDSNRDLITASVGVATADSDRFTDPDSLVGAAESAMFLAGGEGGNRVKKI